MIIRRATAADWPRIYPIYAAVMEHGLVGLHVMFRYL